MDQHTRGSIRSVFQELVDPVALDPLLERVGDARVVLLGEASHGTSEYHGLRARTTRRLIQEKGFSLVAVEGDWADCLEAHRNVTAAPGAQQDTRTVLERFRRWPQWMWANEEVLGFLRWLREYNGTAPAPVGFFGLDAYSLWDSLLAVLDHLREHRPDRVEQALEAYRCFEPYAQDPRSCASHGRLLPEECEEEVVARLSTMRAADAQESGSEHIYAERDADVAAGAERYYRSMVRGGPEAWNVRDRHMADTLDRLIGRHGPGAKVVVWAHNAHVGDARATGMARAGMVNLGQLVRERRGESDVVAVGCGFYKGSVAAADQWGGPLRTISVPPARTGSLEALLHQALPEARALAVFSGRGEGPGWAYDQALGHRAIGVVYRPEREGRGNYVSAVLGRRYDAFVYCDRTRALTPLDTRVPVPDEPETYPGGV